MENKNQEIDFKARRRVYYDRNRERILEYAHQRYIKKMGIDTPRRPIVRDEELKEFVKPLKLGNSATISDTITTIATAYHDAHGVVLSYSKLYNFVKKCL
jgi:hypothetical protein